jgi:hypothetical protein
MMFKCRIREIQHGQILFGEITRSFASTFTVWCELDADCGGVMKLGHAASRFPVVTITVTLSSRRIFVSPLSPKIYEQFQWGLTGLTS